MANFAYQAFTAKPKAASTASIVLAFASVYFFWGSTYTAIRIGGSEMPALLLAVIPLYVALLEMILPGGEPLPTRGWLGMALGFAGLGALL